MDRSKFNTTSAGPICVLLLILSSPLVSQAQTPVIADATVNLASSYVVLAGSNFSPTGIAPTVTVGGASRTVYSFADADIVVGVPSTLPAATYLVTVTNSVPHAASAYVTVGAVGPQVRQAPPAPPARRVRPAHKARLVQPGPRVRLEPLVRQDRKARRVRLPCRLAEPRTALRPSSSPSPIPGCRAPGSAAPAGRPPAQAPPVAESRVLEGLPTAAPPLGVADTESMGKAERPRAPMTTEGLACMRLAAAPQPTTATVAAVSGLRVVTRRRAVTASMLTEATDPTMGVWRIRRRRRRNGYLCRPFQRFCRRGRRSQQIQRVL